MPRRKFTYPAVALVGLAAVSLAYAYRTAIKVSSSDKHYRNKSVSIILSESVVKADLPLEDLSEEVDDIVFILPPGVTKASLGLSGGKPFKFIECDTVEGVFHVLKHLRGMVNFVCFADLPVEPKELHLDSFLADVRDPEKDRIREEVTECLRA